VLKRSVRTRPRRIPLTLEAFEVVAVLKGMMEAADLPQPSPNRHANYRRGQRMSMVTAGARATRGRWRRAKARRKLKKVSKDSGQKATPPNEALHRDQPDRLLLSALKYWEVERDLIEERLATMRSATAAS
jgi:hypothetical protein